MQATAVAHPIQGLVKYHGMRDPSRRFPFHDSISVCTAPSRTVTTVALEPDRESDRFVVDGTELEGRAADRVSRVVDAVRERADRPDEAVHLESESSFPTNVGLGSSSSGMAAAAVATAGAAGLELDRRELSGFARLGSASAARSVTGGFSLLPGGDDESTCRARRLESPLEDELRVVAAVVESYKETEDAHAEAPKSHMFEARLAHVHHQLAEVRAGLAAGDFERTFACAEADSISLAATTMTGPSGWIYWQPTTLAVFETVRDLRRQRDVPAYFSTDTGASVYVNTTVEHADAVVEAIGDLDLRSVEVWEVGGPARVDPSLALF
ncbi:MAG: phosphomevalonate decarboxylase MvaD [Halobacteriales archaeon]